MKLWIDDVRPCPDPKEWRTAKTVNEAKRIIKISDGKVIEA